MAPLTRWVLAHKRIVVLFWVAVTLVGVGSAGSATKALKQKFSVPGKEGWVTNQQIARDFHGTGGNSAPLLPVVTLAAGQSLGSPAVRADLRAVEARLERSLPGSRVASYVTTGNSAFVSKDGRTAFAVAFPPPDPDQPFGDNPNAAKKASAALAGMTVAGAPVHLTGFDALSVQSGGGNGPGVLGNPRHNDEKDNHCASEKNQQGSRQHKILSSMAGFLEPNQHSSNRTENQTVDRPFHHRAEESRARPPRNVPSYGGVNVPPPRKPADRDYYPDKKSCKQAASHEVPCGGINFSGRQHLSYHSLASLVY